MADNKEYKIEALSSGDGLCKSPSVWIQSGNCLAPLFYLRRPKWIKQDSDWAFIVENVLDKFSLPSDFILNKQENN